MQQICLKFEVHVSDRCLQPSICQSCDKTDSWLCGASRERWQDRTGSEEAQSHSALAVRGTAQQAGTSQQAQWQHWARERTQAGAIYETLNS